MIDNFRGQHAFLSNFYPCPVRLDNVEYDSVEHAYQAAKTLDNKERSRIRNAHNAVAAKQLGKEVTKRKDWSKVKLKVMEDLLRQKFQLASMQRKLLATRNQELVEGNYWGDTYWGICRGEGKNHLGKLLMKIRSDIKEGNDA